MSVKQSKGFITGKALFSSTDLRKANKFSKLEDFHNGKKKRYRDSSMAFFAEFQGENLEVRNLNSKVKAAHT